MDLQFTYLEVNPLVVTSKSVHILDLASRLDQTADYLCAPKWGKIEFPPPFGREAYAEVRRVYTQILLILIRLLGSLHC